MSGPSKALIEKRLAMCNEVHRRALRRLPDWPQGMPPTGDAHTGVLVTLERWGFAKRLSARDPVMGDLRFVLTATGRKALSQLDAA